MYRNYQFLLRIDVTVRLLCLMGGLMEAGEDQLEPVAVSVHDSIRPAKEGGCGGMWSLDLFGNEISINAAKAFHAGLKGRYHKDRLKVIISSKAAPIR